NAFNYTNQPAIDCQMILVFSTSAWQYNTSCNNTFLRSSRLTNIRFLVFPRNYQNEGSVPFAVSGFSFLYVRNSGLVTLSVGICGSCASSSTSSNSRLFSTSPNNYDSGNTHAKDNL
ncbi:163_t:CDS:2, partial [Ambispora gerdemannii]